MAATISLADRPWDGWLRRLVGELADTIAAIGHLLAQTDQPTKFGHKLLLAKDQGGFVVDTSLRRQREPA